MSGGSRRWVKICGITNVADARDAVDAGASALGLNFVPSSRRYIDEATAREIADAVRGQVELVAVVADQSSAALRALAERVGVDALQLHGQESPEQIRELPRAFKALGIATPEDVQRAAAFSGERLLLDAKAPGLLGGSGQAFDWSLVIELARQRPVILAGGLSPENVAAAVASVAPYGVDVASGVEQPGNPRRKDALRVRRFIENARR